MSDKPTYIASCSFGKDSIATILLALENGEPLDRVVFAEVMFDHSRGISGELPEHIEWVYSTAIPKLETMGVKVDVVRPKNDYLRLFYRRKSERAKNKENIGKLQGFLIGGKCGLNGEGRRISFSAIQISSLAKIGENCFSRWLTQKQTSTLTKDLIFV